MENARKTLATVQLGKHGPMVGIQGLGCMSMVTDYYGPTDESEARATLDKALDLGVTMFDTADAYGYGKNEAFIGPFVRANRDRVTVATKFGIVRKSADMSQISIENRPEHIRSAVDASLQRLGIGVIDLYYMHRRNPDVPLADSVGAMADLVKAGKVRFLGLSEVSAEELREAHAIHPISAVQTEWSLFSRHVEETIVPTAAELGVGFVPYSPLGRGQLTGQVNSADFDGKDVRRMFHRFEGTSNTTLVEAIAAVGARHGATSAQVALAWLHRQAVKFGLAVVPIPGTRKPQRVAENIAGAQLILSDEDTAVLDALAGAVEGSRDMVVPTPRG
ncbi:aldo/keto reductase [Ralstonia solanacearum]|uniref:aldo/keto reductase n=1 Tax=Ralstonia solanacearum TaxID=305 RepID=UPI0007D86E92|nr:aldo/keto reductase [Ralstonia solanacearum]OAI58737.1 aldo/keto reductase [Ralstonia solanacearum]